MSTQDLEAALSAADSSFLHRRLYELTSHNVQFNEKTLPSIATKYLHVFCDHSISTLKRRWVGLALHKMIARSDSVVKHLKSGTREFTRLGEVILRPSEQEETKIVAGFIIRQALAAGVTFVSFWPSEKVPNNNPFFPDEGGDRWMGAFQNFLDTLEELKMTEPTTDPAILYPWALSASDGYNWNNTDAEVPVVVIQNNLLTIIAPDLAMRNLDFIDIPLHHIRSARPQKSDPYDSQARTVQHEPWDLVLDLEANPWTFHINVSERTGRKFTISFSNCKEAEQCGLCITERSSPVVRPRMSSSQGILGVGPARHDGCRHPVGDAGSIQPALTEAHSLQESNNQFHTTDDVHSQEAPTEDAVDTYSQPPTPGGYTGTPARSIVVISGDPDAPTSGERQTRSDSATRKPNEWQPKASSDTLPLVNKRDRRSNAIRQAATSSRGDEDASVFPDSPPRMKRPSGRQKIGKSSRKPTDTTFRLGSVPNHSTRANPIGPKPKSKAKYVSRNEVSNTEDDEDPTSHSKDTTGPRRAIKGSLKSSQLPKPSKFGNRKASQQDREIDDVFAVPIDDELKPRKRRRVVKDVDYDEESDSGNQSEYVEVKLKKGRPAGKQTHSAKGKNTSKIRTTRRVKNKATKAKSKAETQPMSPVKHAVLSTLLSKPQPAPRCQPKASKVSITDPLSANKLDQQITGDVIQTQVYREPTPATSLPSVFSETRILDHLCDDEINLENIQHMSSPLARKEIGKGDFSAAQHNALLQIETHYDTPHILGDDPDLLKPRTMPSRKRTTESNPPSTPAVKRTKQNLAPPDGEPAESGFPEPPMTIALPRIVQDPSSPCEDNRRLRQERKQPITQSEFNGALAPTSRSGGEHNPPPELPLPEERRRTPMHQVILRAYSTSSDNVELLSSNSKPLPGPPGAVSTAISGHAYSGQMDLEKEQGDYQTAKADPFKHQAKAHEQTSFIRRLTGDSVALIESTMASAPLLERLVRREQVTSTAEVSQKRAAFYQVPNMIPSKQLQQRAQSPAKTYNPSKRRKIIIPVTSKARSPMAIPEPRGTHTVASFIDAPPQAIKNTQVQANYARNTGNWDVDGDDTLVTQEEELPTIPKATPVHFRSSPPVPDDSSSSHSSTSEEPVPYSESGPSSSIPTEDAEDMEWEASLQPHQRPMAEQLLRISRRVVRHVIDNETAVSDIVVTYDNDSQHLLRSLHDRHEGEFGKAYGDVKKKKTAMRREFEGLAKSLDREMERFNVDMDPNIMVKGK